MAEFLISGYYGDRNAGDEAILAGIIRSIRQRQEDARFTVISKKAAYTRTVHGVSAVSRNDFKNIWRSAGRADLLLSGGGSLLQDVSSTKSLFYYLGVIGMSRMQGTPVMAYAQGIGPLNRAVSRVAVATVLNGIQRITVRDQDSATALRALGVERPPTTVTADPALALGVSDPEWGGRLLQEAGVDLDRPVIGVSVRPWRVQGHTPWETGLAKALDRIAIETGGQIVFIPMQYPHDVTAARAVMSAMATPAISVTGDEHTHEHVRAMTARCSMMIAMRFHALVFAAMNGVPLLGLSYDPKNDSFLRAIGEEVVGTVARLEPDRLVDAARKTFSTADKIRRRLLDRIAELTPLAHQNAQVAIDVIRQRGIRR